MTDNARLLKELKRDREERAQQHRELLEALRQSREPAITKAGAREKIARGLEADDADAE